MYDHTNCIYHVNRNNHSTKHDIEKLQIEKSMTPNELELIGKLIIVRERYAGEKCSQFMQWVNFSLIYNGDY